MKQDLTYYANLRQNAEILLQSKVKSNRSESDILKLIHELEVHEIELELTINELSRQNQELEKQANELAKGNFSLVWQQALEHANKELVDKNSELVNQNSDKNKFISIIAHDLRNPLSSIAGFSDILIEQIRKGDYNGIEEYANIIHKSSKRTIDLLNDLMEWVQSMTGRIEFKPKYFDVAYQILETSLFFNEVARSKSIIILTDLPYLRPVSGDKYMIDNILRNLISNAIKFTYTGGKIIISAEQTHNDLIISIKDSGIGISKDQISKLFTLDESYSTPGTNKELGTGLGLILCKEFVEKHGGRIWVESEEGKGSEFKFSIPLKEPLN